MVLSVVSIVVALSINFWALGRTFITSDEGWYMYLFASKEIHSASHAHLLFSWIPGLDQLYANRLTSFGLKVFSLILFSLGFHFWLRKSINFDSNLLIIFGLVGLSQLYIESCPSLNYTILNQVFILLGLGLLFFSLIYGKSWLYAICGFTLSMLIPSQMPCAVVIIFVISTIWILSGFKKAISCVVGFIIGIAFIVFVIESPQQIYLWISSVLNDTKRPENYQYQNDSLLIWTINALKHLFKWGFISWLILMLKHTVWTLIQNGKHLTSKRSIIFGLGAMLTLLYMWVFLYPYGWPLTLKMYVRNIMWVCVLLSCYYSWICYNNKPLLVISILLIISPFFMCFGSNWPFLIRHVTVTIAVTLIPTIMLKSNIGRWFRAATIVMMVLMLGNCAFVPFENWQNQLYSAQDIELNEAGYGQNVKVDSKYIENLDFFKKNIPETSDVVVSIDTWSYAYLLNYHVLRHDYRLYYPPLISDLIAEKLTDNNPIYIIFNSGEYSGDNELAIWQDIVNELSKEYDIDVEISKNVGFAKVKSRK